MRDQYQTRLEARQRAALAHEAQSQRLGYWRLAVAVAAAIIIWQNYLLLPIPIVAFIFLLVRHDRIERSAARERRAIGWYTRAIDRMNGKWPGVGEKGERFFDPQHPYAADLDVFGHGSLFQLMSGARTAAGEQILASWLSAPAPAVDVRARQEAITELKPNLDLREDLALLGEDVRAQMHPADLIRWGQAPAENISLVLRVLAPVLASISLITAVAAFFQVLPVWPFLLNLLFVIAYTYYVRVQVGRIIEAASISASDLGVLAVLLERIEREPFHSARLQELRRELETDGRPPSQQIARLRKLVERHDWTHNEAFLFISKLLLWDPQLAFAIERWRTRSGARIGNWILAVGEIEALLSIAGYAAEHPADPFPELIAEPVLFSASGLAHPLLPETVVVRNDVELGSETQLLLVSGSNMSGKSTLMRSIGLNAVLAWAGAPVRANALKISPLQIGAAMRVQDSVLDGRSRFYAEIMRLRQVVDLASGPLPLLFLLDELLSGTNSHDRRIGAEAVVKTLIQRGAVGLVSTHDLALAHIVDEMGGRARNVHFEDHIEDGQIAFDYTMRPGVVTKSNAIGLMRSIGLDV